MKTFAKMLALSVCTAALLAAGPPALAGDAAPTAAAISKIQRVSTATSGAQADWDCGSAVISPDGTRVLFVTASSTLMGGPNRYHVYMKTLASGLLRRISTNAAGLAGNDMSWGKPAFSPDGTKVLFTSAATNLVAGDTNAATDVFEKNLTTGAVRRLSTTSTGLQANGSSSDARYSADGKKIVFVSAATNLIATDTNGHADVFVKDLVTGKVQRVSLTHVGGQANENSDSPTFSPDGKKVAFVGWGTNLVPGDTNARPDVYVRDLVAGKTVRANVSKTGVQSDGWDDMPPVFHPNGAEVVFSSEGVHLMPGDTNEVGDVFAKNLATGVVRRLSTSRSGEQLDRTSSGPAFDQDGSIFAFATAATDALADAPAVRSPSAPAGLLVTDVMVKNATKGTTVRVSTNIAGVRGNQASNDPAVSADGKLVAFTSWATNLVPGDTNGVADVFVVTLK